MLELNPRLRALIVPALCAVLLAAAVVAVTPNPAGAVDVVVDTAEEFKDAIEDASESDDASHTITIGTGFTWNDEDPAMYTGSGIMNIDGNGQIVTLGDDASSFLRLAGGNGVEIWDLEIDSGTVERNNAISIIGSWVVLDTINVSGVNGETAAVDIVATEQVFIYDSVFAANTARAGDGGALSIETESTVEIDDAIFQVNDSATGSGGALAISASGRSWIYDSHFYGNTAAHNGGAIVINEGSLGLERSSFDQNAATERGGAVHLPAGNVMIYDSEFSANTGTDGGAVWAFGFVQLTRSTFSANRAEGSGGAIFNAGRQGGVTVWSSTFHDNGAEETGGAILGDESDVWVEHSTFTLNWARSGAAHLVTSDAVITTLASVFAEVGVGVGCSAGSGVISSGYTFDDEGTCTANHVGPGDFGLGDDPELYPLGNNGGETSTRLPAPTSPLVNVIDQETCALWLAYSPAYFDQRHVSRPDAALIDGACDVGAVEVVDSVTFTLEGPQGPIEVTVEGAYAHFEDCDAVYTLADVVEGAPAGVTFPHGILEFCVASGAPGSTVTVHLTFPSPVNRAFKVNESWVELSGATFSGSTLTYDVTDGGLLDADGGADGYIVDPLAAGVNAVFAG